MKDIEFYIIAKIPCKTCVNDERILLCPECNFTGQVEIKIPCYVGMGNSVIIDTQKLNEILN